MWRISKICHIYRRFWNTNTFLKIEIATVNIPLFDVEIIDFQEVETIVARCTGENAKKVLLIFQKTENQEELKAFLGKVLSAVQLDFEKETLLLSITKEEKFNFIQLCQLHDIQILIAFGIKPQQLGLHFHTSPYDRVQHEQRTYVFVDDLPLIYEERQQGGKQMSGKLWHTLQGLFPK